MSRQPFWGPNWFILPLLAVAILVLAWFKGQPEKNQIVDLGGGITIQKISDETSPEIVIRQLPDTNRQ